MLGRFTNQENIAEELRKDTILDFNSAFIVAWHSEPHYRDTVVIIMRDYIEAFASTENIVALTDQIRDRTWRCKNPLRQEESRCRPLEL